MKIIFAGTPKTSALILKHILENNFKIDLVLTTQDKPAGRGQQLTMSEVKQVALQNNIEVFQPLSFKKDPQAVEKVRKFTPDLIIVVAYGLILPQSVLEIPKYGCVNIHLSLLPKFRGASPIQQAILHGESKTGVTIMQMDAGLDTGDMLLQEEIAIDKFETSGSLEDKLTTLSNKLIIDYLKFLEKLRVLIPTKQSDQDSSYAPKITKKDAQINWQEDATIIWRKIRAFNPTPGAYTYLNQTLVKVWQAQVINNTTDFENTSAGTIIEASKDKLVVLCGNNTLLSIVEIQEAGKKRQNINQYLSGKSTLKGQKFESNNF